MQKDPYDLLFARNVRLDLGNTVPNGEIKKTFKDAPREFAFSNNGITVLCEHHNHEPGTKELVLTNPRVVNGSQTLHSIRDVASPSQNARVMVRIIEIAPVTGAELAKSIARKKSIIDKIAIRSNLQNPIKKWDLVANDDFQLQLYRFFRRKGFFYERRTREWNLRNKHLKAVGIEKGSNIKSLMQLVASYHWDNERLGPATAKSSVGALFDSKPYAEIKRITDEEAFQIFQLDNLIGKAFRNLNDRNLPTYFTHLEGHMDLVLFSLLIKALQASKAQFGSSEFTSWLERQSDGDVWEKSGKGWSNLVSEITRFIYKLYQVEAKRFRQREDKDLTFNNYFKTGSYVDKILGSSLPPNIKTTAKKLLRAK